MSTLPPLHAAEFELWQTARRLSARTIAERGRVLHQFHAETGVQPAHAEAIDVARWLASHPDWSDATVCAYRGALAAWFKWLQVHDHRTDDPLVKLGPAKTPRRLPRPVSTSELVRILEAPMRDRTRCMVVLAAFAGLRVHEIAKLRAEDFTGDGEHLVVHGKGGGVDRLPVHAMIGSYRRRMPARGLWFPAGPTRPGEHVHAKSVSQAISNAMRRAEVPGTPHALRHWYATALLGDGTDIRVVQELMRHRSIQNTVLYTRVADARKSAAIEGLSLLSAA